MRTYTHGSRCRGRSRTSNKRHGSRNRENKSSMKSPRESLRETRGVETMEEEAASEVEAEDGDSEAGASRNSVGTTFALRSCELAWRWWYDIQPWIVSVCIFTFWKLALSNCGTVDYKMPVCTTSHQSDASEYIAGNMQSSVYTRSARTGKATMACCSHIAVLRG
jgi:hypothetical protein